MPGGEDVHSARMRGDLADRPWGQTFAGFRDQQLTGQIRVVEGDRAYVVAFSRGVVVGASSPLATDSAVRVARIANMISPNQVSSFVRKHPGATEVDEIPLLAALAQLSPQRQTELRKRVIAQRAARTFSPEHAEFVVEDRTTIEVAADCGIDAREVIYLGARQNRSEKRLTDELARMGSWFRIKPSALDELAQFGFGEAEQSVIERLREGCTLAQLEGTPGLEPRTVRAVVYALGACGACDFDPAQPRAAVAIADHDPPAAHDDDVPAHALDGVAYLPAPVPGRRGHAAGRSHAEPDDGGGSVVGRMRLANDDLPAPVVARSGEDHASAFEDLPAPVYARRELRSDEEDLPAPVYGRAVAEPRGHDDLSVPVVAPEAERSSVREVQARSEDGRDRSDTVIDSSNDHADLLGVTVDGRYVLERKLGDNAMATVYLAHHTKLNRLFAVKVLHRRLLGSEKLRKRFDREAELSGRLRHANVISVIDVGTIDGVPYLATEFAEGTSLAELLLDAPLPPPRTNLLLRQICAGLHHAHGHGLIHRDLKPSNVIVESDGDEDVARILDFGIAILREPDGAERLTTRGVILGTPSYMAPELALGRAIDHRLDLYALGVIAFQLQTGVLPFEGDGVDVALANIHTEVPAMSARAPAAAIDPLLEAFTRTLLAKHPSKRPADAAEARKLLELIERDRAAAAAALGVAAAAEPAPRSVREPAHTAAAAAPAQVAAPEQTPSEAPIGSAPEQPPAPGLEPKAASSPAVEPAPAVLSPAAEPAPAARSPAAEPAPAARPPEPPRIASAPPEKKPVRSLIRTVAMWRVGPRAALPKPNPVPRVGSGTTALKTEQMPPLRRSSLWIVAIVVAIAAAVLLAKVLT